MSEWSCGTFELGLSKATLSHHFRVLREAGILRTRPDGRKRLLSLRESDLNARFPGLLQAVLADGRSAMSPVLSAAAAGAGAVQACRRRGERLARRHAGPPPAPRALGASAAVMEIGVYTFAEVGDGQA